MDIFLMHVGHPGNVDIAYTVTRKRTTSELLEALPIDAAERVFFERDKNFRRAFPDGTFNCWGVPSKARPSFDRTSEGDLVLVVPSIGIHREAGIHQIGVIKSLCPVEAFDWGESQG